VTVKARHSTALPRYYGYGRGLTHYTWTSDQHALYGGKPIPSTERDATYVLDEILDNETELPIDQHTTDTAGYSELIFSLFDLVGLQFSPRIRDMADQRLYRLDRSVRYEHIEPLFAGILNQDVILRRSRRTIPPGSSAERVSAFTPSWDATRNGREGYLPVSTRRSKGDRLSWLLPLSNR
jgi:TnpA family transposase